jgi:hypothetical protein
MQYAARKLTLNAKILAALLTVAAGMGSVSAVRADEATAKSLFKAMSD